MFYQKSFEFNTIWAEIRPQIPKNYRTTQKMARI